MRTRIATRSTTGRSPAGLSYLLWSTMPDDELFALAEQGKLRDKAELAQAGAADAGRSQGGALQRIVRRAVAAPAQGGHVSARQEALSRLRQVARKEHGRRDDGVLSRSARTRPDACASSCIPTGRWSTRGWPSSMACRMPASTSFSACRCRPTVIAADCSRRRRSCRSPPTARGIVRCIAASGFRNRSSASRRRRRRRMSIRSSPIPSIPRRRRLRMKLEAHIHDASCASCHSKIDPLGLAFENYDAIGRWRTHEAVEGTGDNPAVNASGKLPDGRAYQTPEEFKQLLLADSTPSTRPSSRSWPPTACGAPCRSKIATTWRRLPRPAVRRIYRLRDLVEALFCPTCSKSAANQQPSRIAKQ